MRSLSPRWSRPLLTSTVLGQAPPAAADPGRGAVIGTGTFTAFVENMDRSLAFYHDAFGMEVPALPASGERPVQPAESAAVQVVRHRRRQGTSSVGARARVRVTVELMEIQDVEHKTIPLRIRIQGLRRSCSWSATSMPCSPARGKRCSGRHTW